MKLKPYSHNRWFCPVLAVVLLAVGCSGGEDSVSALRQGIFLDSPVAGLQFATATQSGSTDASGTFQYQAGENVTFSIGALSLPTIAAVSVVTPLEVFSTDSVEDARVVNLSRLLQSLDIDANPDNGISIPLSAGSVAPQSLDFASATFNADTANMVANSGSVTTALIDANTAVAHLQQTLASNGLGDSGCASSHPDVGTVVQFDSFFHDVAGQLTVVDDCTIEISDFAYDGGGPAVYFYAANGNDFAGDAAFIMGPKLNGRVYSGDRFRLQLPDGKTLDDVDGVSVWCADFSVSFGTAGFGG